MNDTILTILTLLSFGGYLITNKRTYRYSFESRVDKHISLVPIFVIFYSLFFPLILFTYLMTLGGEHKSMFLVSVIISNVLANILWLVFPNGVKRPTIEVNSPWTKMLKFVYTYDGDRNGFPSGHVFLTLVCAYYLLLEMSNLALIWIVLAVGISASTVLTKQHYVLDIVGGILVAVAAVVLTSGWMGTGSIGIAQR